VLHFKAPDSTTPDGYNIPDQDVYVSLTPTIPSFKQHWGVPVVMKRQSGGVFVRPFAANGTWTLTELMVIDHAGNYRIYGASTANPTPTGEFGAQVTVYQAPYVFPPLTQLAAYASSVSTYDPPNRLDVRNGTAANVCVNITYAANIPTSVYGPAFWVMYSGPSQITAQCCNAGSTGLCNGPPCTQFPSAPAVAQTCSDVFTSPQKAGDYSVTGIIVWDGVNSPALYGSCNGFDPILNPQSIPSPDNFLGIPVICEIQGSAAALQASLAIVIGSMLLSMLARQ
jgi:hypothetical protein